MFVGVHAPIGFNSELLQRYTSLKLSYSEACDFPTFFFTHIFLLVIFFVKTYGRKVVHFYKTFDLTSKTVAGPLNKGFIKAGRFQKIVVIKC